MPKSVRESFTKKIENLISESQKNQKRHIGGIIMRNPPFFMLEVKNADAVCRTILFSHHKKDILCEILEESDRTVRILDLLEVLLSDEGKRYMIYELDRCLHPSLTYKFVDAHLQMTVKKKVQLTVTTHEFRLLAFDLLRRNEIGFEYKRKSGEAIFIL